MNIENFCTKLGAPGTASAFLDAAKILFPELNVSEINYGNLSIEQKAALCSYCDTVITMFIKTAVLSGVDLSTISFLED